MAENYKKYSRISNRMRKTSKGDKKSMLQASNNRCERCGMSVRGMPTRIIYKNEDKTDNRKSNVMILCRDCSSDIRDGKTPVKAVVKLKGRENVKAAEYKEASSKKPKRKSKKKSWWKFW